MKTFFKFIHTCAIFTAALCLGIAATSVSAAPSMRETPFSEIISRDISSPIALSDIDVAVFIPLERCTPPTRKNLFGNPVPLNNKSVIVSWYCRAFVAAMTDPNEKLAIIPILSKPDNASVEATVATISSSLSARRYVALVDWDVEMISEATSGCLTCRFSFAMTSEVVVFDREFRKMVWHSAQVSQASSAKEVDAEKLSYYGPSSVQGVLNRLVKEKDSIAIEQAGIKRVTATVQNSDGAATGFSINKAANLIIFSDFVRKGRNETYGDDGLFFLQILAPHLSEPANKIWYSPYYKTHIALRLPEGKYELIMAGDKPYVVDISPGKAATYLRLSKGGWSAFDVEVMTEDEALALGKKSVNLLMPELTPAAYLLRKSTLQWVLP